MLQISFFAWLGILLCYVTYCAFVAEGRSLKWYHFPGLFIYYALMFIFLGFLAYVVLYPVLLLVVLHAS